MTPGEATQAVANGATVRLLDAHDRHEYAVGKAISYSLVPTITIELSPGGSRISWRHDLAEVVAPPKPAEPTGLGAVVEDEAGNEWVRGYRGTGKGPAWYCDNPLGGSMCPDQWEHWAGVRAVKVLSEGMTA